MDLRTGKTYETREEAIADNVPPADLVKVRLKNGQPIVKFSKGSFKAYRRDADTGALVRVEA